jgi:hypothetical protein
MGEAQHSGVYVRKSKGSFGFNDGGSYFHTGSLGWRDANKAPKLNNGGGMPPAPSTLDCRVIRLFAARRLASNGPGTLLPCLRCCGQVVRKNRVTACERTSSETQTWSRAVLCGDGTARQQAMGGRRIKRGGHRMGLHAPSCAFSSCLDWEGCAWQRRITCTVRAHV